ncbi:hypothetical protein D7Z54_28630 [Salibacterium salarium]|uniref:Uncharacterized protein n=1 Tax=Salibacterium salarium TaxID=284579 RepID=A0A428MUZ2_9BACI|nr:hypothetical protein [Salibacterium salarium]RSL29906.1 hypothetical protein D7Z54_28630 [Salibacterium salarium]
MKFKMQDKQNQLIERISETLDDSIGNYRYLLTFESRNRNSGETVAITLILQKLLKTIPELNIVNTA